MTTIQIDVGPMNSIRGLHETLGRGLREYRNNYRIGLRPEVVFYSKELIAGQVNISCLAILLAAAERLRIYTSRSSSFKVNWNPNLFTFLYDIGFFEYTKTLDILHIDDEKMGGFQTSATNPNTRIIYFPEISNWSDEASQRNEQKDRLRSTVRDKLIFRCGEIFKPPKHGFAISTDLRDQILITTAELVVNSNLWGKSSAFVALQRSGTRITVSVSDAGVGFTGSLEPKKGKTKRLRNSSRSNDDINNIGLGSIMNEEGFGLRRAVDGVVAASGWVHISTHSAAIVWRRVNWAVWKDDVRNDPEAKNELATHLSTAVADGLLDKAGYSRFSDPLRGSRVVFEIPLNAKGKNHG